MTIRPLTFAAAILSLGLFGCTPEEPSETPAPPPNSKPTTEPADGPRPISGKKVAFNKANTLFLETLPDGTKRVLIETEVCLREGQLELLVCRKNTKEHEAVLAADVDARDIHTVLLAIKAKPGSPVKWQPKFTPASGTTIKIAVQFQDKNGKTVTLDAKQWVRSVRTRKALEYDWVFAGSRLYYDPEDKTKPPIYMANSGDVISVANFPESMLDLPVDSSKDNADLSFEAWTDRIPERGAKVTVILEPVLTEAPKK